MDKVIFSQTAMDFVNDLGQALNEVNPERLDVIVSNVLPGDFIVEFTTINLKLIVKVNEFDFLDVEARSLEEDSFFVSFKFSQEQIAYEFTHQPTICTKYERGVIEFQIFHIFRTVMLFIYLMDNYKDKKIVSELYVTAAGGFESKRTIRLTENRDILFTVFDDMIAD